MVEDTKMTDNNTSDETAAATAAAATAAAAIVLPPLAAAAQRLDRLLSDKVVLDFYTNPVKVVRRWLGTSSGAAADAAVTDIQAAAFSLLDPDPAGGCATGRALLIAGYQPPPVAAASTTTSATAPTDIETDDAAASTAASASAAVSTYLTLSSAREVESWLISLAVRLLWKQGKPMEALELAQKGIDIAMHHLEAGTTSLVPTSSSSGLFPLLARLYRLRSLAAESCARALAPSSSSMSTTGMDVASMAEAHNLATLRRDVDTQATILNSMLRDLLRNSQGKLVLCSRTVLLHSYCHRHRHHRETRVQHWRFWLFSHWKFHYQKSFKLYHPRIPRTGIPSLSLY